MKPLTIEDFRAWLQQQPDDREFEVCNGKDCPLAVYVNEGAIVGTLYITMPHSQPRIPLPNWAREFIWSVDHAHELRRTYEPSVPGSVFKIKNATVRGILELVAGRHEAGGAT